MERGKTASMEKFKPPEISWTAHDLHQELHRFNRQAQCIFEGPLHEKEESAKVSYLNQWVGDKGLDVFEGFTFAKPECRDWNFLSISGFTFLRDPWGSRNYPLLVLSGRVCV